MAQAVTIDMLGPRRSYSMETRPLAMLLIIMAMVKGDTRDGPRSKRRRHSSSMLLRPQCRSDHDAEALAVHRLEVDAGVGQGALGRSHGELGEAVRAAGVFRGLEVLGGLEIPHFTCNLAIVDLGIKGGIALNATASLGKTFPEGFNIAAHGADNA